MRSFSLDGPFSAFGTGCADSELNRYLAAAFEEEQFISDRERQSSPASARVFDRTERLLSWALMVFLVSQGLFFLQAPDLGHHLVYGRETLENGLPSTNVFSPVNREHPMVQHE